MKLLDILNERKSIPEEFRGDTNILKEYLFKDWQTFNQKVVPSFRLMRNRIVKESYSSRSAKNTIMNIVEFAAKKYVAECTSRKYMWNEVFPKESRYALVNELVEFFERYNLTETYELITEQGGGPREAKITFSEIEVEVVDNQPKLVINFNYDEETTNYITNILGNGQGLKLSDNDFQLIQNMVKIGLTDVSSGQKMSYLKFNVNGTTITRIDLKHLTGGAFLNRIVNLEVIATEQPEQPEEPTQEPEQAPEEEPVQEPAEPELTDREIKEIVNESIKKFIGEK